MTFILGLTGSIGMGKSTTAQLFRQRGVPVYDADQVVHDLYRKEAVPLVAKLFPTAVKDGMIDRVALGKIVFGNPDALRRLEAIIHPLVHRAETEFVVQARESAAPLIILDIPLLLEKNREGRCDAVIVVSTDFSEQKRRVMSRPDMTEEKFNQILERQVPDDLKRKRAHIVIETGRGIEDADRQVAAIIKMFNGRRGRFKAGGV